MYRPGSFRNMLESILQTSDERSRGGDTCEHNPLSLDFEVDRGYSQMSLLNDQELVAHDDGYDSFRFEGHKPDFSPMLEGENEWMDLVASGPGSGGVAIDNKIEQAMDLVKSHLMFAVREEVELLKETITELKERISDLEYENGILRAHANSDTLALVQSAKAAAVIRATPTAVNSSSSSTSCATTVPTTTTVAASSSATSSTATTSTPVAMSTTATVLADVPSQQLSVAAVAAAAAAAQAAAAISQ
ncbi:unnamed protein product [Notodromas monacha]|uniref:Uncharacterized protein n=2 Tax=Notodromas monacha TaxID=399045 RepID=A0A7R9C2U0_9CRUS|nr:unnamed protein product [Notodromas monacha]CAG0924738.1 unnamed protein product [Notodromas monacha]